MCSQVASVGETSVTFCTLEGFLSGVGSDVTLQQPGTGEGLVADVALAGQSVGLDVHLQSTLCAVNLLACRALEFLLFKSIIRGTTVGLDVLLE